ncbi:DUF2529 family protein [Bacillus salinus]|uniref:DUF2529 family protein n=1 Tax=Bacillus sp. HMF5848 TaxID=2495421 RepID=UPI001639ADEA|nr:DUF2529 family protein [Bacillus sp. HMF5848]
MSKIFTTQLLGLFNKIQEQEAEAIEDSGRLLAQAIVGDGTVYVYGQDEMKSVVYEALYGKEGFPSAKELTDINEVTSIDRVFILARDHSDEKTASLCETLYKRDIPFIVITSNSDPVSHADVVLRTHLKNGLVPGEDGVRRGYPYGLLSLYIYHLITLNVHDILEDM